MTIENTSSTLEVKDLSCVRGERMVFKGVNFTVKSGGGLIVHGPNGSGKSSLLRVLAGLLRPFSGEILWNGIAISDNSDAYQESLHYVGHLDAVKPILTVRENLSFWTRYYSGNSTDAAIERLGLKELSDVPARLLSAGQRRRLGIARILTAPATLWLLDEPTVTLDGKAVATMESIIAEHRLTGGMVIAATHANLTIPNAQRLQPDRPSANQAKECLY